MEWHLRERKESMGGKINKIKNNLSILKEEFAYVIMPVGKTI